MTLAPVLPIHRRNCRLLHIDFFGLKDLLEAEYDLGFGVLLLVRTTLIKILSDSIYTVIMKVSVFVELHCVRCLKADLRFRWRSDAIDDALHLVFEEVDDEAQVALQVPRKLEVAEYGGVRE